MQILTLSWQKQLRRAAAQPAKAETTVRIAVLGVGNEFNGDDAAGILTVRALRRSQARAVLSPSILVIDAGLAPENFSGKLRSFGPQLVILIDAALMDAEPGEIRWLAWQAAAGQSASTHTLPLSMFSSFITRELGCQVALLGVQPLQTGPGYPVSLPVRNAVRRLTRGLLSNFNSTT
jgi:hydrogenase 3 maturation protease